MNLRGTGHHTGRGFSLIELMVTVTVISVLLVLVVPSFSSSISASRERSVVQKFAQDFDWLRGSAGTATVSLTLNANCTWSATVNGVVDAAHSSTTASGLACSSSTLTLPVAIAINAQGYTTTNGTLTFTGTQGQSWPLQVLYSGSLIRLRGAS